MTYSIRKNVRKATLWALIALVFALLWLTVADGFANKAYALDTAGELCIISDSEDLAAFAEAVGSGETFKDKTVVLTCSLEVAPELAVKGTFEGAFKGLGNTLTLTGQRSAPFFESLSGALVEDLALVFDGSFVCPDSDPAAAVFIGSAEDSTVIGCFVSGNIDIEISAVTPEEPEDTEAPDTTEEPETTKEDETDPAAESPVGEDADPITEPIADEPTLNEPRADVIATAVTVFAESAERCSFYGCKEALVSDAELICLVMKGSAVTLSDIETHAITAVVSDGADITVCDLLSFTLSEGEGVVYFEEGASAEELTARLNGEGHSPELEGVWQTGELYPELHRHGYKEELTAKTCIAHERTSYVCSCTKIAITIVNEEAGYADHTPADGGTTVDPTCTEEGYTEHTCSVCNESFRTDIKKAKGHKTTLINQKDSNCVEKGYTGDTVCTVCDELIKKGSTTRVTKYHFYMRTEITKEPTSEEEGELTYYCQYCDATKTEVLPCHVRSPFESFDGTHHRSVCSCGEVILETHEYEEIGVSKEATHTQDGVKLYKCSVCMSTKEIPIPALGHSHPTDWEPDGDVNHKVTCSCGDTKLEAHSWAEGVIVSDGISDGTGEENTLFECTVCAYQKIETRMIELPPDPEAEDNGELVKRIALIALALLFVGGVGGYVYIKFTERK